MSSFIILTYSEGADGVRFMQGVEAYMKTNKRKVGVSELAEGMTLAETIFDIDGKTLFSEGLKLNKKRIDRIFLLNAKTIFIEEIPKRTEKKANDDFVKNKIEEVKSLNKERVLNEARVEASKVVENIIEQVMDARSIKSEKITKIVEKIIGIVLQDDKVVLNLANLSSIDDYIFSHSVNVCVLSLITGIFLGLNHQKLLMLGSGALIHDIGKMLVPVSILNKPDKLTEEEYKIIQQHTVYGHKILRDTMKFSDEVATIALSHHERVDGKGYPNQLSKNEISKFSKIVGITDVFDAITSKRVYCDKISYYKGVEYLLKNANTQFDGDIVKKFITIIGYYPIGLYVQLNTGDIGMVISKNKLCPVVKVTIDSNGNKLRNHYEIDINRNPSISIVDINLEEYQAKQRLLN